VKIWSRRWDVPSQRPPYFFSGGFRAVALLALVCACSGKGGGAPPPARTTEGVIPKNPAIGLVRIAIDAMELDDARKLLGWFPADSRDANVERARLAIYEEKCTDALRFLSLAQASLDDKSSPRVDAGPVQRDAGAADASAADAGAKTGGELDQREGMEFLQAIAEGCARVTAGTVTQDFPELGVSIRFQDGFDKPLAQRLSEVFGAVSRKLASDLEIVWPKPIRITVVRDAFVDDGASLFGCAHHWHGCCCKVGPSDHALTAGHGQRLRLGGHPCA
jgi:hypothetical protein